MACGDCQYQGLSQGLKQQQRREACQGATLEAEHLKQPIRLHSAYISAVYIVLYLHEECSIKTVKTRQDNTEMHCHELVDRSAEPPPESQVFPY